MQAIIGYDIISGTDGLTYPVNAILCALLAYEPTAKAAGLCSIL